MNTSGATAHGNVHAILLAGSRPERDVLAEAFGVPIKALVPVAGEPMVSRVARTLVDHPRVARVTVLIQDPAPILADPGAAWMGAHPAIAFEQAGSSVSEAIAETLRRRPDSYPFLVTTADHALLDHAMIDGVLASGAGADAAAAVVERRTLLRSYPESRRTWLKFRGGAYSGANIFLFGSPRALKALDLWRTIESQRKRAGAIVRAFGPLMLFATAVRLVTLKQGMAWASRRLGVHAVPAVLPIAEACIDVDKVSDHALVSEILARRG